MTTILTKKKDTSGAPAPGDLTNAAGGAELAVNTADKRLYTKDSGGNVVEIGTNPTILNIDNIQIDGSTISSTNTNGDINITPNGTGSVVVSKLNVTGAMTFDGNVTVGNSSADTLVVNSTITSNLIFTDNTYDIGASGATRPRNLYLSGLLTMGGALTVNGNTTLGDASGDILTINGTAVSTPNGLNFDSNTLVIDAANNRVGFGTTSPSSTVDILLDSPNPYNTVVTPLTLTNSGGNQGAGSRLSFATGAATVFIQSQVTGANSTSGTALVFGTSATGTVGTERLRLTALGGVETRPVAGGDTVFNEDGVNADFRVESDNNTNAIWVDASADTVYFGGTIGTPLGSPVISANKYTAVGLGVAPADPSTSDLLTPARFSVGGDGGNYLAIGTYTNATSVGTVWMQSSYYIPSVTTYNMVLQPLGGNVGVGRISSAAKLHVEAAPTNAALQILQNSRARANGNFYGIEFRDNTDEGNANIVIRQQSSGNNAGYMEIYANTGTGGNGLGNGVSTILLAGSAVTVNEGGADLDFRVESDNNTHAIFVDASTDRVGIFNNAPGVPLDVTGTVRTSSSFVAASTVELNNATVGTIALRPLGASSTTTIEAHIRPGSGKKGYVTFTEDSVADRWAIGIENSDSNLYFRIGTPTATIRNYFSVEGAVATSQVAGKPSFNVTDGATSIANNGTVDFAGGSGMMVINNYTNGNVTIWLCGGGSYTAVASVGSQVGTMAYQSSVDGYRWTNTYGSTATFGFYWLRTRPNA